MNKVMSSTPTYSDTNLRFYPQTFCTVSTIEGSVLECQLDLYVHELKDFATGLVLKACKPVLHEIEVNGVIEHINSVFVPQFEELETI